MIIFVRNENESHSHQHLLYLGPLGGGMIQRRQKVEGWRRQRWIGKSSKSFSFFSSTWPQWPVSAWSSTSAPLPGGEPGELTLWTWREGCLPWELEEHYNPGTLTADLHLPTRSFSSPPPRQLIRRYHDKQTCFYESTCFCEIKISRSFWRMTLLGHLRMSSY